MPLLATPYPHVMNGLNGPTAPKYTFLIFYSNVVDGKMWCPDCRNVEDVVKRTFDAPTKPKGVIFWVGKQTEWRQPTNEARKVWNVQSVPTILRLENQANPSWTSTIIVKPNLFSHLEDEALLPPEAGHTGQKRDHITCYDPSTGCHLLTLPLRSVEEVSAQIATADAAQGQWSQTTFEQRRLVLRSLKQWILRDMDGIVRVACRDTGKTRVDAVFGEILTSLSKIDWLIKHGERALKPSGRPTNLLLAHKVSEVHYVPLGTVAALVSWNYSFHNLLSPLVAALFTGNSIVLKCSEQVAWSSMWFIGGVQSCLRACGFDDGVVQLVVCLPDVAETVTRNPLIKHITFIGSEPVGKKVAAAAAELMIPTCIELGGKDPAVILPSADLDFFASTWLRGAFQSSGQNCIGIELFLVHRSQYDRFLALLTPRVESLLVGPCLPPDSPAPDVGSLISHNPIPRLVSLLESAVESGARILAGGKPFNHRDYPQGAYFKPTLIADVTLDMAIAKEELFAPVMTVVPYDDVNEVVDSLNRSRFGLGASVWGRDRRQCREVAGRLECGMVAINDFVSFVDKVDSDVLIATRTSIPRPLNYPLPHQKVSWAFLCGLVGLAYSTSLVGRIEGLVELLQNL
ncbi:hypothetical protein P7C73_g247, partial [Tremellales sp. Uapishka_1]